MSLHAHIEGLGFTDISEKKDRLYFKSCYVRSPGWALDEPADAIGSTLVFPPWFADRKDEMVAGLKPANFLGYYVQEPLIVGPETAGLTCILVHGRGQPRRIWPPWYPTCRGCALCCRHRTDRAGMRPGRLIR